MKFTIHLAFDGQCEAAFKFYEKCFGGRIVTMVTWGDPRMAAQTPPGFEGKILHATLAVGDANLAGSDSFPGQYEGAKGFSVIVGIDNPVEAERVFDALAENGRVQMPLQETFWAVRFGVVVDQFGLSWEINCEI